MRGLHPSQGGKTTCHSVRVVKTNTKKRRKDNEKRRTEKN